MTESEKKVLIFARDARTAQIFAGFAKLKPSSWKFLARPEDLRGRSKVTVYKVTTWEEHRDALRICEMMEVFKKYGELNVLEVEW